MLKLLGTSNVKEIVFSVKVFKADGTVSDLGVVQYYHRNPLKQLYWRIKKWLQS